MKNPTSLTPFAAFDALTQQQQAVYLLIAEGLTNEQIADRLRITLYRVKVQRAEAQCRMGCSTSAAITRQVESLKSAWRERDGRHQDAVMTLSSCSPVHQDDFFRILEIREFPQLVSATSRLVAALGFDAYFFAARIAGEMDNGEQRITCFGTYPDAWMERYTQQRYDRIDPVVLHCEQHHYPLVWTPDLFTGNQETADFYEEARAYGISAGGMCPQFDINKGMAGLSFARSWNADVAQRDIQRVLPMMYMLSGYVFETLQNFLPVVSTPPTCFPTEKPRLTNRERECLLRAVSGLNDSQIADQLNLTRRTVYFHLTNIRHKLGAANRTQMVAQAILKGLLSP